MIREQVFYSSDHHISHRLVSRIRGFHVPGETEFRGEDVVPKADIAAHDAMIAQNWDEVISKDALVYVLGDISINGSQAALDWFRARPGRKVLATGNHDPVHPGFSRNGYKKVAAWREVFLDIQPYYRISLAGQQTLLSHLSYAGTGAEGIRRNGEQGEDRGPQWRLPDLGLPLLHGHTHGPERAHLSDNGSRQLHVGLDAWNLKPVPQSTVMEWLSGKEV